MNKYILSNDSTEDLGLTQWKVCNFLSKYTALFKVIASST